MTDLIARLTELEKAATPNQMAFVPACKHDACQPNGGGCLPAALGWQEGDGAVNIFAFWNYMQGNGQPDKDAELLSELRNNLPAILRALKVQEAAEEWEIARKKFMDGVAVGLVEQNVTDRLVETEAALSLAVKGEQP